MVYFDAVYSAVFSETGPTAFADLRLGAILGRRSKQKTRGTNLLEMVLALAFCAMALLAVLSVQAHTHQALQKNREREKAHTIALSVQAQTANLLAQDFSAPVERALSPHEGDSEYQVEVVSQPNDPVTPTVKKVTVSVWYHDRHGRQRLELWCYYDTYR